MKHENKNNSTDCQIIGSGVSGLMAGRKLIQAGLSVHILAKGRASGGQLATPRVGEEKILLNKFELKKIIPPATHHRCPLSFEERGLGVSSSYYPTLFFLINLKCESKDLKQPHWFIMPRDSS